MQIANVNNMYIEFDNGHRITWHHCPDCCERNYADFEQLEEMAWDMEFDEDLKFELTDFGFRFGSVGTPMFFIPCYSEQNGYYSHNVDILYNGMQMLVARGMGVGQG